MSFVRITLPFGAITSLKRKQRRVSESHAYTQREASCLDTQIDGVLYGECCMRVVLQRLGLQR
jgi:hypothetical protein